MQYRRIRTISASVIRFANRPRSQKILVVRTLILILCIRAALSIISLKKIFQILRKLSQGSPQKKCHSIEAVTRAVSTVGRRCPGATCLVNGLAGHYLLTQNGYEPVLHVGVKKKDERSISAHAWVCLGREVVIGATDDLDTYTPFQGFDERI